jgi:hypothetical protein
MTGNERKYNPVYSTFTGSAFCHDLEMPLYVTGDTVDGN